MQFEANNYPGIGIKPTTLRGSAWNRTGGTVAIGDVVMVDMLGTQTEDSQVAGATTVTTNQGADSWPLNNIITPATAGIGAVAADPGYWFGVVTDLGTDGTGADNSKVGVTYRGYTKMTMAASVATPQWGKPIVAADAVKTGTLTTAAGRKVIARLMQDTTTANALADVLLDGIDGFGPFGYAS